MVSYSLNWFSVSSEGKDEMAAQIYTQKRRVGWRTLCVCVKWVVVQNLKSKKEKMKRKRNIRRCCEAGFLNAFRDV